MTTRENKPYYSKDSLVLIMNAEAAVGESRLSRNSQFAVVPHLNLQGNGWFGSTNQPKIWGTHHRQHETQAFPARVRQ